MQRKGYLCSARAAYEDNWLNHLYDLLAPLAAAGLALLIGAVMLLLLGAGPVEGYTALFQGAFGSRNALADTAVRATPLLLIGLGICIAFRANVINIGGEGQMIMGRSPQRRSGSPCRALRRSC